MSEHRTETGGADPLVAILRDFLSNAWHHRLVIAASVGIAVLLGMVVLSLSQPVYVVTFKVTPVVGSQQGAASRLGGLASLAGISLKQDTNAMAFDIYTEELTGQSAGEALARNPDIMHVLFAGEWDAKAQQWRQPVSIVHSISQVVKPILGLPVNPWVPPNAERVQALLASKVSIDIPTRSPIVTVSFQTNDRKWGEKLLWTLHKSVDDGLRQKSLERAERYIVYLNKVLSTVTVSDYREALIATLIEQEKTRMVASAGLPFAADPIGQPTSSSSPISPRPLSILFTFILLGGMAGLGLAWYLKRSGRSISEIISRLFRGKKRFRMPAE